MSRDNDDAVLRAIKQINAKVDYDNPDHLRLILQMVKKSEGFLNSAYGRQYIRSINERLAHPKAVKSPTKGNERPDPSKEEPKGDLLLDEYLRQSDEKLEGFFRDIDDNLFHVASQSTMRTTQKLVWFNLGLTVINTIVIFFIALFVWNLNMGR